MPSILIDLVTFAHLAAMAAGLGAAVFTDSKLLWQISHPMKPRQIEVIEHAHAVITIALAALWITGVGLVGLKAGFDPLQWSPKLWTKLGTVSVLTCTAIVMATVALPHMKASVGKRLIDAPMPDRFLLAVCAGMSAGGWLTALMLGSSKILKTAGDEVAFLAIGTHAVALVGTVLLSLALAKIVD